MKFDAVIFDLGNTLVSYHTRAQWPGVLQQAIGEVGSYLRSRQIDRVDPDALAARVEAERGEREDCRVVPLADRLTRIFRLSQAELAGGAAMEMCREFLKPIFAVGRRYDDVLPALAELRRNGVLTGILSNSPWGSPAELWTEELDRHGLLDAVDAAGFCTEVGWRKPAPQAFEFILKKLNFAAGQSVFVGDDPRWDLAGPRAVGMAAILIDRTGSGEPAGMNPIRTLAELPLRLQECERTGE